MAAASSFRSRTANSPLVKIEHLGQLKWQSIHPCHHSKLLFGANIIISNPILPILKAFRAFKQIMRDDPYKRPLESHAQPDHDRVKRGITNKPFLPKIKKVYIQRKAKNKTIHTYNPMVFARYHLSSLARLIRKTLATFTQSQSYATFYFDSHIHYC